MFNKFFLCLLVISLVFSGWTFAVEWEELSVAEAPPARDGHISVEFAGKVYIFGGKDPNADDAFFDDTWEFSNDNWREVDDSNPPSAREGHTAAVIDDKIYLFGGQGADGAPLNDLHSFDFATNTWTSITPTSTLNPAPSTFASATTDGNKLYLHGGIDQFGDRDFFMWEFDPATNAWARKAVNSLGGRSGHTAILNGDSIFHFFGNDRNGDVSENIAIYNITSDFWTVEPVSGPGTPQGRTYQAMAKSGNSAFMFGGQDRDDNILSETWEFDFNSSTWIQRDDTLVPFFNATASFVGSFRAGDAFVFGGQTNDGTVLNKTFQYAPDGIVPPQEKELTAQIGTLAPDRCALFILKFREKQQQVKVTLEWNNPKVDLQILGAGIDTLSAENNFDQRYEKWMGLDARTAMHMLDRIQKQELKDLPQVKGKIIKTEKGQRLEVVFTNTKFLRLVVKQGKSNERCGGDKPKKKIVRNVQVTFDSKDNPKKFTYLFPVGPPNNKKDPTVHNVCLPDIPVRWHSLIPFFTKGDEATEQNGNSFKWSFTDRSLRIPFFGYVKFVLP